MKPKIVIIGGGGHGKVVCDAIIDQDQFEILGFVDVDEKLESIVTRNFKVIESQNNLNKLVDKASHFIVAIGNNKIRENIYNKAALYLKPATIIHPTAIIGFNVTINDGSVVLSNSVINNSTIIGKNCIINAGTIIDHDCKIGNGVHLSIGTKVGSTSSVADYYTSSIGQCIPSFSSIM